MLILTNEQMQFAAWQIANSDCETLADCMAVYAELEAESASPQLTPCIEFTAPTVTPCVDVELECEARMAGFAIRRFLDLAAR